MIADKIKSMYNQWSFPEFLPALVGKVSDNSEMLARLFETGNDYCSSSTNAGILLGFSLCGKEGEDYFLKAIFSEYWEATDFATGNVHQVYQGLKNLNFSLIKLFTLIIEREQTATALKLLFAMLQLRTEDSTDAVTDSYESLYVWLLNNNHRSKINDLVTELHLTHLNGQLENYTKLIAEKLAYEIIETA